MQTVAANWSVSVTRNTNLCVFALNVAFLWGPVILESLYSRLFNDIFLSWRNECWKQGECFLNIISLKEAPVQKGGTYLKVSALISVFTVNTQLLVLFVTPLNPSPESNSTFRQRTCNIYCNNIIIQLQFLVHLCWQWKIIPELHCRDNSLQFLGLVWNLTQLINTLL